MTKFVHTSGATQFLLPMGDDQYCLHDLEQRTGPIGNLGTVTELLTPSRGWTKMEESSEKYYRDPNLTILLFTETLLVWQNKATNTIHIQTESEKTEGAMRLGKLIQVNIKKEENGFSITTDDRNVMATLPANPSLLQHTVEVR